MDKKNWKLRKILKTQMTITISCLKLKKQKVNNLWLQCQKHCQLKNYKKKKSVKMKTKKKIRKHLLKRLAGATCSKHQHQKSKWMMELNSINLVRSLKNLLSKFHQIQIKELSMRTIFLETLIVMKKVTQSYWKIKMGIL